MTTPLLIRVAAGDSEAVEQVIDAHGGLVWALALRMLPDRGAAEDAVQEIFIKIWQHAGRFDETKGSEQRFIVTIARRHLIDCLRRQTSSPRPRQVAEGEVEPTVAAAANPSAVMEKAELGLQLRQLMYQLQPQQRQVLTLSMWEGASHAEIAKLLNLPLGTVKSQARRGLEKLRQLADCLARSG